MVGTQATASMLLPASSQAVLRLQAKVLYKDKSLLCDSNSASSMDNSKFQKQWKYNFSDIFILVLKNNKFHIINPIRAKVNRLKNCKNELFTGI